MEEKNNIPGWIRENRGIEKRKAVVLLLSVVNMVAVVPTPELSEWDNVSIT